MSRKHSSTENRSPRLGGTAEFTQMQPKISPRYWVRRPATALIGLFASILMANTTMAGPRGEFFVPETLRAGDIASDRVIAKFRRDVDTTFMANALQQMRVRCRKPMVSSGVSILEATDGKSVEQMIDELKSSGIVEYAEPDYIVQIDSVFPNDPEFSELWGLHNSGDADIDAPESWGAMSGDPDAVVAVIDTGIDYTHVDLQGNIWTNPGEIANGIDDDGNGYVDDLHGINCITESGDPFDDNGHGTHVAGTIGAVGDNREGIVGVAWDVQIMALKFLGSSGRGYVSDAIECLEYATWMKAAYGVNLKLTNNSWGGGGFSQALYDAIEASGDTGMLFVAAAGNDYHSNNDVDPVYPSSYDLANILAVAASDSSDELADFSNFGPTSVDLAAPGQDILSLFPGDNYMYGSGTSMAAPHVSGAAVLAWACLSDADAIGVKQLLLNSVDPLPAFKGKVVSDGRLNLFEAMRDCVTGNIVAAGRKLVVMDQLPDSKGPIKRKLKMSASDDRIVPPGRRSVADPTVNGAVLRLVNPNTAEEAEIFLPASGWQAKGSKKLAYQYSDRFGPCSKVFVKPGSIKASCGGVDLDFTLDEPSQEALTVTLQFGEGAEYCVSFGRETVIKDDGIGYGSSHNRGLFSAKRSRKTPPSAQCLLP